MDLYYQTKSKPSGAALIWRGKITPPVDVQPLAVAYDPRCYFDAEERRLGALPVLRDW